MTTEKEVETALVRMVKGLGGLCLKWVCPGHSGVPDRIVLLPGGRLLFVELKRPRGGRIAPLQRKWQALLLRLGFAHYFVFDREAVEGLRQVIADEWGLRAP